MGFVTNEDGSHMRYPNGKQAWKCEHCGLVSAWTESWVWYGSYFDADDGTMLTFCCQEHGDEHERALPSLFESKKKRRRG